MSSSVASVDSTANLASSTSTDINRSFVRRQLTGDYSAQRRPKPSARKFNDFDDNQQFLTMTMESQDKDQDWHNESDSNSRCSSGAQSPDSDGDKRRGRPRSDVVRTLIMQGLVSPSSIKCQYCTRVFPREKSLQAHLRTHTGEKPYICDFPECTRAFTQSGQLKTHQRLHAGEKPFVCSHTGCSVRFTHANRHCPSHPSEPLKRSYDFVLRPVVNNDTAHGEQIKRWLEKYKKEREQASKLANSQGTPEPPPRSINRKRGASTQDHCQSSADEDTQESIMKCEPSESLSQDDENRMSDLRVTHSTTPVTRHTIQPSATTGANVCRGLLYDSTQRCFGTENHANTVGRHNLVFSNLSHHLPSTPVVPMGNSNVQNHCIDQNQVFTPVTPKIPLTSSAPESNPESPQGPKPAKLKRRWLEQSYQQENIVSSSQFHNENNAYTSHHVNQYGTRPGYYSTKDTEQSQLYPHGGEYMRQLSSSGSDDQARPSVLVMASPTSYPASVPSVSRAVFAKDLSSLNSPYGGVFVKTEASESCATFHGAVGASKTLYIDENGRYFQLASIDEGRTITDHHTHIVVKQEIENNHPVTVGNNRYIHNNNLYHHQSHSSAVHLTAEI